MVYLRHLLQFKESVEASTMTLTHWFDWSAKVKVLNTKLCIQWGIMHASLKISTVLSYYCFVSIGDISTFQKNWMLVWGESIFRYLGWAVKWVMPLWSKPTGHSITCGDPTLRATFGPKIDSPNAVINIRRGTVSSLIAKS